MRMSVCRSWRLWSRLVPPPPRASVRTAATATTPAQQEVTASSSSSPSPLTEAEKIKKERKMSTAMQLYLQRKRQHDMFIAREQAEFEMGKQHLANMMGMDPDSLTQADIDKSIEYLFPSGLAPEARPVMKPPEEIFPKQKEAEFDYQGRPYQTFFYTQVPDFYDRVYRLRDSMEAVTIFGDRLRGQGKRPDPQQILNDAKLADTRWISQEELTKLTLESISEQEYKDFIILLDRLVALPFSYRVRDEIFQYRISETMALSEQNFITPQYDEQGRAFVEAKGQRKSSVVEVKVTKPGTGNVIIRHKDSLDYASGINYFFALKDRHQLLFPLQFTKMLGLVDVEAVVSGGGSSSQAGALRYAIAMCLRSFVEKSVIDDMKICGLLTQDIRVRERKKFGKAGARKSYTWKRR